MESRRLTPKERAALEAMVHDIFAKGKPGINSSPENADAMVVQAGMKDLEAIRNNFLEFQRKIQGTCLSEVVAPAIKELADFFMTLDLMLTGQLGEYPGGEELMAAGRKLLIDAIKEGMRGN